MAKKKSEDAVDKPVYDCVLRVTGEANTFVREYAEARGFSVNEAATRLLLTARGRLAALKKWVDKQPKEAKAAKPKAPKAKKAAKPKAPKAKPKKAKAPKTRTSRKTTVEYDDAGDVPAGEE